MLGLSALWAQMALLFQVPVACVTTPLAVTMAGTSCTSAKQAISAAVKAHKARAKQLLLTTGKLVTVDLYTQPAYGWECNTCTGKSEALVGY